MRWVCTLSLLLLAAGLRAEDPSGASITIQPPQYVEDQETFRLTVTGRTTSLPENTVLIGTLLRGERAVTYGRADVDAEGRFKMVFALEAALAPARYTVRVEGRPPEEGESPAQPLPPASLDFDHGTPEEQATLAKEAREKLQEILDQLGRGFQQMSSMASYDIAYAEILIGKRQVQMVERRTIEKKRIEIQQKLHMELDRVGRDTIERLFRMARLDFNEYKEQVSGGLHLEVEKDIESLTILLDKWYVACWKDVADTLGMPLPQRLQGREMFPRRELEDEILLKAHRAYKALGKDWEESRKGWESLDSMKPEIGKLEGDTYVSYISRFRISAPSAEWFMDFQMTNPIARLRMFHRNEEIRKQGVAVAWVEIVDYPHGTNRADLDRICEVTKPGRWKGFKRIKGAPISRPDPTMPGGIRQGYDSTYLTQEEGKEAYRVWTYELYGRDYKWIYGVVFMAKDEAFPKFEKEFEKTARSLAVLDDPRELEKEEKKK